MSEDTSWGGILGISEQHSVKLSRCQWIAIPTQRQVAPATMKQAKAESPLMGRINPRRTRRAKGPSVGQPCDALDRCAVNRVYAGRTSVLGAERKRAVTWPDVLRVLQDDKTRALVVTRFQAAGFKPDQFASRRAAREVLADCLSRAEDWIECERASSTRDRERSAIRRVRRALEQELWG